MQFSAYSSIEVSFHIGLRLESPAKVWAGGSRHENDNKGHPPITRLEYIPHDYRSHCTNKEAKQIGFLIWPNKDLR